MGAPSCAFSSSGIVEEVHTGKISPTKFPLRVVKENLYGLESSIRDNGLLYPLIVRPLGNRFEIVAGNRRFQACKSLKFRRVPCVIVDIDDKKAFEISIIENVQRDTLNPIEEAHAFKQYVQQHGWGSISDLAKRISKSVSYVSRRIKLLSLPAELQEEILRQRKSLSIISEIVAIKDGELEKEVSKFVFENELSEKDTRSLVNKVKKELNPEKSNQASVDVSSKTNSNAKLEEMILRKLITVLKIALARSSDIISESNDIKDTCFKQFIIERRYVLHQLIDSFISMQKKIHRIQRKNNAD